MAANTTSTTIVFKPDDHGNGRCEGSVTFSDTALTATDYVEINCGFKPRYAEYANVTDLITVKHYQGMTDDTCIKIAAADGAQTLETTNQGITLTSNGFRISQNATLAVCALSTVGYFKAVA